MTIIREILYKIPFKQKGPINFVLIYSIDAWVQCCFSTPPPRMPHGYPVMEHHKHIGEEQLRGGIFSALAEKQVSLTFFRF